MLDLKELCNLKPSVFIICSLLVLFAFYLIENSHAIMRFLIGQETRLSTVSFMEIKTENYDIKYTGHDLQTISMIAETSEKAYYSVAGFFDSWPDNERITMIVYPDQESLGKSFGWGHDASTMGVYWGGTIRILSPTYYIKEKSNQDFWQKGPMVHELTHYWIDTITAGNYPRWWTEGVAQYVEREQTGFVFSNPFAQNGDYNYYSVTELDKNFDKLDSQIAYWESLQIIDYLVTNYGENSLFIILDELSQNKDIKYAIEKVTQVDYFTFQTQVNEYFENLGERCTF